MKKLATSEFDEEDVGFENLSSTKKAKRIIIALTVVLLLVFVLCLIFIVLFALEKSKVHEQAVQESAPQLQICDSKKCLFAAVGKFNSLINYFCSVPVWVPMGRHWNQGGPWAFHCGKTVDEAKKKNKNRLTAYNGLCFIRSRYVCSSQDLKNVDQAYLVCRTCILNQLFPFISHFVA